MTLPINQIVQGDARAVMAAWPDASIHMAITSPPYWGLRDYGLAPQPWPAVTFIPSAGLPEMTIPEMECCFGLEPDPWSYVGHSVLIFRELRRVLRDDGTLWLNLGDAYACSPAGNFGSGTAPADGGAYRSPKPKTNFGTLPAKNLIGIPWMVAKALQADGWFLRQDIIWH